MTKVNHPMQPVQFVGEVIRFKPNKIVEWLCDTGRLDLNEVACMGFSDEDREQLAQLVGYSVSGYGDLSYVSKKSVRKADRRAERARIERDDEKGGQS